jgi:hypothetical protein
LKEHYRIEVPASASRHITQRHAEAILLRQESSSDTSRRGVRRLIAEMDGTNVPIVRITEKSEKNQVKGKTK